MGWGTDPADVNQPLDTNAQASEKAPAYTGKALQNTRNSMVQGYVQNQALIWKGIPYGQAERWKAPTDVKA